MVYDYVCMSFDYMPVLRLPHTVEVFIYLTQVTTLFSLLFHLKNKYVTQTNELTQN
jgi:hypothetical protein